VSRATFWVWQFWVTESDRAMEISWKDRRHRLKRFELALVGIGTSKVRYAIVRGRECVK